MIKGYQLLKSTMRGALAPHAHRLHLTGPYRGNIDGYTGNELHGWVVKNGTNEGSVTVGLFVSEGLIETTVANMFRADVRDAGIGDGMCGFSFPIGQAILAAAETGGGTVYVRVLDGSDYELGSYDLPSAASGGLKENSPHMEQCRKLLFGDMELLSRLLKVAPETAPRDDDRPGLEHQNKFFSTTSPLPEGAVDGSSLNRLPAYLEYTKYRTRKERDYDTDGNPDDRDHFLNWYLSTYATVRNGLRVPLTRELIAYLNEPVVMGGQKFSLSRVMWWRLVRDAKRLKDFDLNDPEYFAETVFWWAASEARTLFAEDCLVPTRYVDLMRSVHVSRKDDAFPLSTFMEFYHRGNSQFHFLSGMRAEDRQLFTLCLVLMGVRRPDLLRYVPHRSLVKLFDRPEGRPSIFESFCQSLTLSKTAPKIGFDRFAAVLRDQGYDIYSHNFLSVTEDGNRLEAASLPLMAGKETAEVQLIGPFEKASGLGQATRLSAGILAKTGLKVNCVNFGLDNPAPEGFSKVGAVSDYKRAKINLIHLNAESIPLVYAYAPDVFSRAYNIGYFYWELDSPALCHYLGMELLDEIWVSTEYGVSIYQPEIDKPVTNVGMCYEALDAIDHDSSRALINQRFRLSGDEFLFLVAFDSYSFIQRKNPVGVLQAFQQAFEGIEDVRLIIKTQNRDNVSDTVQERMWNRIDAILARDPRIMVMNETLSYEALLQLKAASDCYISLHKSEGWGFGMIEAMNLHVPVVCTAYSGNMDFCSDETAWLVDYEEVALGPDDYIFVRKGQKWAEPDVEDAAAKLRAVYSDPIARKARADAAFETVHRDFSEKAIAERYGDRLREILQTL